MKRTIRSRSGARARGATTLEYLVVSGVVALASAAAFAAFDGDARDMLQREARCATSDDCSGGGSSSSGGNGAAASLGGAGGGAPSESWSMNAANGAARGASGGKPAPAAALGGKSGSIDITVASGTSAAGMDKAGVLAAEQYMKTHPGVDYVDIRVVGTSASGVTSTTTGGWTRNDMNSGAVNKGAFAPGTPAYTANPPSSHAPPALEKADGL